MVDISELIVLQPSRATSHVRRARSPRLTRARNVGSGALAVDGDDGPQDDDGGSVERDEPPRSWMQGLNVSVTATAQTYGYSINPHGGLRRGVVGPSRSVRVVRLRDGGHRRLCDAEACRGPVYQTAAIGIGYRFAGLAVWPLAPFAAGVA